MFADNTLTPKEATRLCALGILGLGPMTYSTLAMTIRHFISRVIGPTPEIMGHSIELLKYEGLVEAVEGSGDEALLRITDDGRGEMQTLLTANLRATRPLTSDQRPPTAEPAAPRARRPWRGLACANPRSGANVSLVICPAHTRSHIAAVSSFDVTDKPRSATKSLIWM